MYRARSQPPGPSSGQCCSATMSLWQPSTARPPSPFSVQTAQHRLASRATLGSNTAGCLPQSSLQVHQNGLHTASLLKRIAVKSATQKCRDKQVVEFEAYLHTHTSRDLYNFIPADFEAYIAGTWIPKHGRSGKLPSNSSVDKVVSNLRTEIGLLGREGLWSSESKTGNLQTVVIYRPPT